jgi:hypothetical protein
MESTLLLLSELEGVLAKWPKALTLTGGRGRSAVIGLHEPPMDGDV